MSTKVHYIWWGNPTTPELIKSATETPNMVADLLHKTHEVYFWIGGSDSAPGNLSRRLHIRNVKDMNLLSGTSLATENTRFKNLLQGLSNYRAYAACKDLLSFAVLYTQGGYFFDTTTRVGAGYRKHLSRLLTPWNRPKVVLTGGDKAFNLDDDSKEYVTGFSTNMLPPSTKRMMVPNVDVWTLYSPRRSRMFKYALMEYMNRAENVGMLDKSIQPLGSRTIESIMNDTESKDLRNNIISGLSISSVLQAMHKYSIDKPANKDQLGWKLVPLVKVFDTIDKPQITTDKQGRKWVNNPNDIKKIKPTEQLGFRSAFWGIEDACVSLPQIGIQKKFNGSWR